MSAGQRGWPAADEVSALILAAGSGARMADRPKAFLKVGGATLVERVVGQVRIFAAEVIVGVRDRDIDRTSRLLEGLPGIVIAGGATRQGTVERLLARATRRLILLHEAARPLTPPKLFSEVLAAADTFGAATAVFPVGRRDSLALRDGEFLGSALPRDDVIATQTPQAFDAGMLAAVVDEARRRGWDEASIPTLCVRAGRRVRLVPGDAANVKITFPEDWKAARRSLRKRDAGAAVSEAAP